MRKKSKKQLIQPNLLFFLPFLFLLKFFNSWLVGIGCILTIFGVVVITLKIKEKRRIQVFKQSGISEIDQMDGIQFEHFLAALFKHQKYKVEVTAASGDFGADLVVSKDHKKIVIQAKRYSKPVGLKAVQEVAAAKLHYGADEAWVVTNNRFTSHAKNLANSTNVELIDRQKLIPLILQMNPHALETAQHTIDTVEPKSIRCNQCGGRMTVKKGKYGQFYGCENYPTCKETKAM